jgi:intein/homing endonuclease
MDLNNKSIYWDEITEIEYLDPEENEYVYDFSVEDVETFSNLEFCGL